jgi:hypothetical protein
VDIAPGRWALVDQMVQRERTSTSSHLVEAIEQESRIYRRRVALRPVALRCVASRRAALPDSCRSSSRRALHHLRRSVQSRQARQCDGYRSVLRAITPPRSRSAKHLIVALYILHHIYDSSTVQRLIVIQLSGRIVRCLLFRSNLALRPSTSSTFLLDLFTRGPTSPPTICSLRDHSLLGDTACLPDDPAACSAPSAL